jgi:hypothetical protein
LATLCETQQYQRFITFINLQIPRISKFIFGGFAGFQRLVGEKKGKRCFSTCLFMVLASRAATASGQGDSSSLPQRSPQSDGNSEMSRNRFPKNRNSTSAPRLQATVRSALKSGLAFAPDCSISAADLTLRRSAL